MGNRGKCMSSHVSLFTVSMLVVLSACGGSSGGSTTPPPPPPPPGLSTGPEICAGGNAGDFSCAGIDLKQRVSLATMQGTSGNDIWGWVDVQSGSEYALMGMTNGTAFVDVSDPENPVFLGILPTETVESSWRDIKVYADHAYIVADGAGAHGMQVFDLTRLRTAIPPETFMADVVYGDFASAHNLAINEDTGFAYVVGTSTCDGLHIVNISTPNNPLSAGCHVSIDIHDAQCVNYLGPDTDHAGSEICMNSAEDRVSIADVSNKPTQVTISEVAYPDLGYVHQAWLTEDHEFLLVGDEIDELNSPGQATRTHVFDVTDLDAPAYVYAYEAATSSIDHNLYVLGNRVFQANYTTGLRVLDFNDLANSDLMEIAFFDTFPGSDTAQFDGAWSVYPYFPSGTIIVSDISNGLFILTLQ